MLFHYSPRPATRLWSRLGLGLAVLLGSAGLVLANTLSLFTADYTGAVVQVEWEVSTETDVHTFQLSRRLPNEPDFTPLGQVRPTGRLRYVFTDSCLRAGSPGLLPGPVAYRLTLNGPGPDQSYTTLVPGTTGPVQRSWGTIKAMFR